MNEWMNERIENEWTNWAPISQVKFTAENYWTSIPTITPTSFPSSNLSLFQWPNCTAPLFCFYTINLKLWQGSVTPILCGRDLREKAADFLHPLTVEPTETQKYQIFQTKFGETRGKTLFVVVSGEKIRARWKKKEAFYFSGENSEK